MDKVNLTDLPFYYPLEQELDDMSWKCRQLGINALQNKKLSGDNLMFTCPNPEHDESRPSWGINIYTGEHNCFACGFKGDFLHFITNMYSIIEDINISRHLAYKKLIKEYLDEDSILFSMSSLIDNMFKTNKKFIRPTADDIEKYTKEEMHIPYLKSRGFEDEIIKELKFGYNYKKNSVTLPAWDMYGRPVFISERFITPFGDIRYYYPDDAPKTEHVYMLDKIVKDGVKEAMIVEGILDAAWYWQHGIYAIATFGANISKTQAKWIIRSGIKRLISSFDNDKAGYKAYKQMIRLLGDTIYINKIKYPRGINDPMEMTKSEIYSLEVE